MTRQKYLCILNGDYYIKAKEVDGVFYFIQEENLKLLKCPSNIVNYNFIDYGFIDVEEESNLGRRLTNV